MSTLRVTETKNIRRPIDVVRSHYSDIRHHMLHNVHPSYPLEIVAEDDRTCTYNQHSRLFGRNRVDVYVIEAKTDGTVYLKAISGPTRGTEQVISFRALADAETEVSVTLWTQLSGFGVLMAPFIRRHISRELKTVLEEDRVDMEVKGYQPRATKKVP
jgi:hypothetical protein